MSASPFKRGDFWTSVSPGFVGGSIAVVQKFRTIGFPTLFTHGGLFLNEDTVFESLWKVQQSNVWDHFEGKQFLVGRWRDMTDEKFDRAWEILQKYEGKWYPAPRLLMFLLAPMLVQLGSPMRYIGLGLFSPFVCTELEGLGMKLSGFSVFDEYLGMMPARVAQIIRRDRDVEIIYDEILLRRPL